MSAKLTQTISACKQVQIWGKEIGVWGEGCMGIWGNRYVGTRYVGMWGIGRYVYG